MIAHWTLILCSCSGTCQIAFTTDAVVVDMEVGGQNIGPTSIVISCDLVGSLIHPPWWRFSISPQSHRHWRGKKLPLTDPIQGPSGIGTCSCAACSVWVFGGGC